MERRKLGDLNLWQFDLLAAETQARHFVSDRGSSGADPFALSFSSHPDKEVIRANRAKLALAMGIPARNLVFPSQVHGTRIVHVDGTQTTADLMETDALVTDKTGLCIAVMSADCVPILLYDRANQVAAAVHSGWRGTVARILEKTLALMSERFGTRGINVIAGIGPSVSQDAYEVGEEVIEAVCKSFGNAEEMLSRQPNGKARLDLWKANKQQLLQFGVPPSHIEISSLCTVQRNDYFFSARKGDTGRFAAGIMIV